MASSKSYLPFIATTAIVDPTARIGPGTKIWAFCQVAEHAEIGADCVIGNGAYIDRHVKIGDRVRIQSKALLYHGLVVEDDVFIGPGAVFTNDPRPRSGKIRNLKGLSWKLCKGASIGANVTVLPDVEIGAYAMVGAGAVVTRNVPSHAIFVGNPARLKGYVCRCGAVRKVGSRSKKILCSKCGKALACDLKMKDGK